VPATRNLRALGSFMLTKAGVPYSMDGSRYYLNSFFLTLSNKPCFLSTRVSKGGSEEDPIKGFLQRMS